MKNIFTIVGARPQFIKAAAVSRVISRRTELQEYIVHTGQHYDDNMSDVFFRDLGIPEPKYNLGIGGGSHGAMTGKQIESLEKLFMKENPDVVLVYGDTNSTLAGAISAVKLLIPVVHVEAGLRSYNRLMPEEINRVLTDHAADVLLAPTEKAVRNLHSEGLSAKTKLVGDVMYDAALFYLDKANKNSKILDKLSLRPSEFILATIHRAENTDNEHRLSSIVASLIELTKNHKVVFPLHPRTKSKLAHLNLLSILQKKVVLADPLGYLDMVMLEKNASLIVTDSGGVQKEAFFHNTPCVTLRDETEWTELVDLGWNRLVKHDQIPDLGQICNSAIGVNGKEARPYGNGHAAESIVEIVAKLF